MSGIIETVRSERAVIPLSALTAANSWSTLPVACFPHPRMAEYARLGRAMHNSAGAGYGFWKRLDPRDISLRIREEAQLGPGGSRARKLARPVFAEQPTLH